MTYRVLALLVAVTLWGCDAERSDPAADAAADVKKTADVPEDEDTFEPTEDVSEVDARIPDTQEEVSEADARVPDTREEVSEPDAGVSDTLLDTSPAPDAGVPDTRGDTSQPDAGVSDTLFDASQPDVGVSDTLLDTSQPDAGVSDTLVDASQPDAGVSDTLPDTSKPDATVTDTVADTSKPDTTVTDTVADTSQPDTTVTDAVADTSKPDTTVTDTVADTSKPDATPDTTPIDAVADAAADAGPDVVDVGPTPDVTPDPEPSSAAAAMCTRWNADRVDLDEGDWTGSTATCNAGDVTDPGRANALRQVNLYRWLAGLPAVTTSAERNAAAQQCAALMEANGSITHFPATSWKCWNEAASAAAAKSNIATLPGVYAVDLYMIDPGNATTLGHRRYILGNKLGPVGFGSTPDFSCMWVLSGTGSAGADWTAWPPPGPFPMEANAAGWSNLDKTGWSLQSDTIDLAKAVVTVKAGGTTLPVIKTVLGANYGSKYAISFRPNGWKMTAGTTYDVVVTGVSQTIQYEVEAVDCMAF